MSAEREHGFELGTDGPRVIVAGLDGSESSWRAAAYAAGLARRQNALLALVYVQPLSGSVAPGVGAAAVASGQQLAEQLEREVREAAERSGWSRQLRWEFHTFPGEAYTGIAQAADQMRADAVVIGASEQAGHRLVGSVAVRLVKHGRWPVTVVP
ncbi:universal stress protein [Phaeacidiphilus oryzae]|uniref:universal stress protein n=1 Tax=Phaeacidiphilus oryzae TaxID=348818 RepID=UPI00056D900F|nr:universal stress protein [Phaeacidiphilus oryzae]